MLGGFLALLAAATFAFNNATARRGVLSGSVAQALAITTPLGVPMFLVVTLAAGALGAVASFSSQALIWLCIAGIIHFVWGRYCNYRATKAMGAILVGPVQQCSLVLTLALAIWMLGETMTPQRRIGIGLVLLGPWLTHPADEGGAKAAPPPGSKPAFQPNYVEGYVWAVLSSTGYGVSPVFVRMALEGQGLGASLAGGLISYVAASVVVMAILLWPGQWRHARETHPEAVKWFALSGVLVCLSQIFRYMALAVAPVSVVTPIQRLSIVFRVHAAWLLNRDHEVFGGRVLLGTFVSLMGAAALSISTELVLSLVPLPDWLVTVARWQWP